MENELRAEIERLKEENALFRLYGVPLIICAVAIMAAVWGILGR